MEGGGDVPCIGPTPLAMGWVWGFVKGLPGDTRAHGVGMTCSGSRHGSDSRDGAVVRWCGVEGPEHDDLQAMVVWSGGVWLVQDPLLLLASLQQPRLHSYM